jgi:hypothetical protein
MGTTREDIREWLAAGKAEGASHVIVVCDDFSYEDYPVYVKLGQDVRKVFEEYNGKEMQRVMEVYALHLDWEVQLNERRAFHFEEPPKVRT